MSTLHNDLHVQAAGRSGRKSHIDSNVTGVERALRSAEWSGRMLARTEALCRSGSFEVNVVDGRIEPSDGLLALLGLPRRAGQGFQLDNLYWVPSEERAFVTGFWRNARREDPFEFQHRIECADGRSLVVLHRGVLGVDGDPQRGVALLQDVTAQRDAERRIDELANFDEVTGLSNRASLLHAVDTAIQGAAWDPRPFSVLALNVARIDEIQVTMGFGASDTLAMAIAARLRSLCGDGDTAARLGGGEFALLLAPAHSAEVESVLNRAQVLRSALQQPERLGEAEVVPTCVVGVATFPRDGDNAQQLLERAQTARLSAGSGAGIAFFTIESNARAVRELNLESALRHAADRGELELRYQPQVELNGGTIVGVEALLRWNSKEFGAVPVSEFIPLAERTDLVVSIGGWVLREACRQSNAWRRAGLRPIRIGVNVSARELAQPGLPSRVQSVLLETGAEASSIGLEITETLVMSDADYASSVLRQLKAIGIEISMDDFGTGQSSLSNLRQLPIDVVKIDRTLVPDVAAPTQDVSVTRAIISMAHSLRMRVIAEGVETEGQLGLLVASGCDLIQGDYFSHPVSAADIERMLREERRLPESLVTRGRKSRTLLLVDDEENVIASLRRLFRRDGYRLLVAASGMEGLQRLAEGEVDVIVSDQRMPGMTGVEFLQRAKEIFPNTVRMVLSGYTDLQSIIDAVNDGAIYKFLTKPWDDQRLRAHVAEAFRQKEMADENRRLAREVESANARLAALNERLQQTLAYEHEHARLLESSASGALEIFDSVPASVIGVDPDGIVAFVNRAMLSLLPEAAAMIGRLADEVLPPSIAFLLDERRSEWRSAQIGERRWRVAARPFQYRGTDRGRLLFLVAENSEQMEIINADSR